MTWQKHVCRGTVALIRAEYDQAEEELQEALARARKEYGPSDARSQRTLGLIGQTYYKRGELERAVAVLQLAVSGDEPLHQSLAVANDMVTLASIKRSFGDVSDANRIYQRAIDILQQQQQPAASEANHAVSQLERMFSTAERTEREDTFAQFQRVLTTARKQYDAQRLENFHPPDVATIDQWERHCDTGRMLMAHDHPQQNTLVTAYHHFHTATKLAYRLFPHDDVHIADSLALLGSASAKLKLIEQAEALLKRSLVIYSANNDNAYPLAMVHLDLAQLYADLYDYLQSVKHFSEAARILESTSELSDASLSDIYASALTMMSRAELYSSVRELIRQAIEDEESDHLEQSAHLYETVITLLRRLFPSDHLEIAQMLHFRANVLQKLGDPDAALADRKHAKKIEADNADRARSEKALTSTLPPFRIPPSRIV